MSINVSQPTTREELESIRFDSHLTLARDLMGRGQLFALLDAARDPSVALLLTKENQSDWRCLLPGRRNLELRSVAPYLVWLPEESPRLHTLLLPSKGADSRVFFTAEAPIANVFTHLRQRLIVETEDGHPLYFRFYDPRVLEPYLESASDIERRSFFGPITEMVCYDAAGCSIRVHRRGGAAVSPPRAPFGLPLIRDDQTSLFSRRMVDGFVDRMLALLEDPNSSSKKVTRAWIAKEMERAQRYEIATEEALERWLRLARSIGPRFDERFAWIRHELQEDRSDDQKLARIERRIRRFGVEPMRRAT